ncbi:hypothetical protein JYK14_03885 [Siccirubricoccus sp. KC 17139]|uniref:Lipid A biosynthesis lauroyl acyltransferase n=1 Tax=Siccirubricoccus soli TaxID=2899147 RepID=A0ABT1D0B2_9PROT|nr:hypothetical protein [Siccirubricoccus soli]MCO6415317.1 hypothetical protein [Siccirubricoccus soli]MCP2681449.1 hypothetical protein [Siccirubricoccus soli]
MRALLAAGLERALFHPLKLLPSETVTRIGAGLARGVVPRLYPHLQERAMATFRALRPDLDPEAATAESWGNIAASFAEMSRILRFWEEGRVEVVGEAHLRAARTAGPLLLAGLHLGNPEVLGLTLAKLGLRPVGVATRQPSDFREQVITDIRLRGGGRMIRADRGAGRPAIRVLEGRQETLLFWMDDYIGGVVRGPSLGRGPRTEGNIPYAVRLARLTGCAIVPGFVERLPGTRFRTHFLPPVALPPEGSLEEGAAALDAVVDAVVRERLTQWLFTISWRPG